MFLATIAEDSEDLLHEFTSSIHKILCDFQEDLIKYLMQRTRNCARVSA